MRRGEATLLTWQRLATFTTSRCRGGIRPSILSRNKNALPKRRSKRLPNFFQPLAPMKFALNASYRTHHLGNL